jgi:hypothetical protein
MPSSYKYSPYASIAPSFTINRISGWNNRTLYSFYGSPAGAYDYYNQNSSYDVNVFTGIDNFTYPNDPASPSYKGQYAFPPRYFSSGKNILIKGRLVITTDQNPTLNLVLSTESAPSGQTILIAKSNGTGHDHTPPANRDGLIMDFEIMITCIEGLSVNTNTSEEITGTFMQANGAIQYSADDITNNSTFYVPISSNSFTATGNYLDKPLNLITDMKTQIKLSFDGSHDITRIIIPYLIMQEIE